VFWKGALPCGQKASATTLLRSHSDTVFVNAQKNCQKFRNNQLPRLR
jgi:hypothetical protein